MRLFPLRDTLPPFLRFPFLKTGVLYFNLHGPCDVLVSVCQHSYTVRDAVISEPQNITLRLNPSRESTAF